MSPATPDTTVLPLDASAVRAACTSLGFDLVGLTRVRASDHGAFLRRWLDAGRHGDMGYLSRADAVERRIHPDREHPDLRSAIVVGLNYFGGDGAADGVGPADGDRRLDREEPTNCGGSGGGDGRINGAAPADGGGPVNGDHPIADDAARGIIARYARGRDYHKVVKAKLIALLRRLEEQAGRRLPLARACVDTAPVLERELAVRAGLGWFGRSTMLINPARGSYFFLAALLTEVEFDAYDEPFARDHCGSCNACVDACPTGALLGRDANGAPVIDATRCISYLTIENRGPIPRELRPLIGNRIFGCDICQEVCPFSRKFSAPSSEPSFAARGPGEPPFGVEPLPSDGWHPGTKAPSLVDLMSMDESGWEAFSRGSPLRRAGRAAFRRNVAVALGNWGDEAAVPPLTSALGDSDPIVRSHSAWALGRVGSASAVAALETALSAETDHAVIVEIEEALAAASSTSAVERGVPAR